MQCQTLLTVVKGDITEMDVDAIVNSTDEPMTGGGEVNKAIHAAAGPELLDACLLLGGCKTGDAKITPGFKLPAKYVIHAVGPVWKDGKSGEEEMLVATYLRVLEVAQENNVKTLALPSISTGSKGYPYEQGAHVSMRTISHRMKDLNWFEEITFVCFDNITYEAFCFEKRRHHLLKQVVRSL